MDTKELETLNPLYYSPVNVNRGLFGPPFPVVHDQPLCLAHVQEEVVVLAPHCQFSDLLTIGYLIVVGDQATVVSSANLMMVLKSCLATQSCVSREYRRD